MQLQSLALLPASGGHIVRCSDYRSDSTKEHKAQKACSLCFHLSAGSMHHYLLQVACIAHFQSAPMSFLASEFVQAAAQPADLSSPSLHLAAETGNQRRARKRRAEEDEESCTEGERWQSRLQSSCLRLPPELTAVAQGLLGLSKKVGLHRSQMQMTMCLLMR